MSLHTPLALGGFRSLRPRTRGPSASNRPRLGITRFPPAARGIWAPASLALWMLANTACNALSGCPNVPLLRGVLDEVEVRAGFGGAGERRRPDAQHAAGAASRQLDNLVRRGGRPGALQQLVPLGARREEEMRVMGVGALVLEHPRRCGREGLLLQLDRGPQVVCSGKRGSELLTDRGQLGRFGGTGRAFGCQVGLELFDACEELDRPRLCMETGSRFSLLRPVVGERCFGDLNVGDLNFGDLNFGDAVPRRAAGRAPCSGPGRRLVSGWSPVPSRSRTRSSRGRRADRQAPSRASAQVRVPARPGRVPTASRPAGRGSGSPRAAPG